MEIENGHPFDPTTAAAVQRIFRISTGAVQPSDHDGLTDGHAHVLLRVNDTIYVFENDPEGLQMARTAADGLYEAILALEIILNGKTKSTESDKAKT